MTVPLSKEEKENCDFDISYAELETVIKELKTDKSPGMDGNHLVWMDLAQNSTKIFLQIFEEYVRRNFH